MKYKIEELSLKNDSAEEQIRTKAILDDLMKMDRNKEVLSEHERDYLCKSIMLSRINVGKIEDYAVCDNFKFKFTYLTYFFDLTGGSIYNKPRNLNMVKVELEEKISDLEYLDKKAFEWDNIIRKENHVEQLLQQTCSETRFELKQLYKLPEFATTPFLGGRNRFLYKKKAILLQSKYLYLIAKEIFESFNNTDFILNLNGQNIEITEYSIIHILNRHYSEISKQYSTNKSFHNEAFYPRFLNINLKEIFVKIDKSKILLNNDIKKIAFRYLENDYMIYTEIKTKQAQGQGNIQYRRLQTFYHVIEKDTLIDLKLSYSLIKIDQNLSVYQKRNLQQ